MYSYAGLSFGLPHSMYSLVVSGNVASSIVLSTSTNGTCDTTALNRSGRRLLTTPINNPPALPPSITSRSLEVYFILTSASALAMKSVNVFILFIMRSEEHTSELQSQSNLVCRLLLEKKKK